MSCRACLCLCAQVSTPNNIGVPATTLRAESPDVNFSKAHTPGTPVTPDVRLWHRAVVVHQVGVRAHVHVDMRMRRHMRLHACMQVRAAARTAVACHALCWCSASPPHLPHTLTAVCAPAPRAPLCVSVWLWLCVSCICASSCRASPQVLLRRQRRPCSSACVVDSVHVRARAHVLTHPVLRAVAHGLGARLDGFFVCVPL